MATARPVRDDELSELLALYQMLNPDDPEPDPDVVADQFESMLADQNLEIVVVDHDGTLVATCLLSITPNLSRGVRPFGLIENVVTHEDYRGDGFGKQVLGKATDLARARDCYKIMLLTGTEQEWKLEFYERCGFDRERKTAFEKDLR